ncbi:efflux RND transporter periplasmic adaptor subunit [Paludisphaera mucosa]|uniref:Efflux RND transporter periplasmic adaptor subunit n=1 Tax=Paludisphaera mucosa TaxID=3030827 RepID=A0ABT6F6C1_9BACT|nr:efflux RND transporter periplasmic adaptor subunit [Paludisphaera mucosa]MDG3002959.1 efflux RND transporter periplasmic adaptor subunit [Paludisphaera mucosa]
MLNPRALPTKSPRSLALLAAAVVAGAFSGCAKPVAPKAPPPPMVGVVESRRMDVPVTDSPNGTMIALEEVTLRARVRGFITERHFEEGAFVKKGQLLFVIDEEPYKVALESARAKQAEADAAVRKAEQSKNREMAAARVALDVAQLNLKRIEERRARALLSRNAGSQEDLDRAEADRKQFEAQVEADQANYDQAMADYDIGVLSAKAQLDEARAGIRQAELDLGYCRMTSPIDGRIGVAIVKVGNLVGPGQEGGSFSELATIQQLDPIAVDIRVSSRFLDRATQLVRNQAPVQLTRPGVEGEEQHPYLGQLYFIDNRIDETTSTFMSKARMPNPHGTLLPGEYVKLKMEIEQLKDVVVVPGQAVMETESGPVVYIIDKEGKVAIQRVKAGLTTYQGMRVLFGGLEAGVPVIIEGLQMIRPGMPVTSQTVTLARPVETPTKAEDAAGAAPATAAKGEKPAVPKATPVH